METVLQDLRLGFRSLARNPRFALLAGLTLALGIGANTAIFSVVNAVLLKSLPYPNAGRLVAVREHHEYYGESNLTYATFLDLRNRSRSIGAWVACRWWTFSLVDMQEPESIQGSLISAEYLDALGIQPVLGRFFTAQEDAPGAEPVAVIGHGLWQRRFGSSPEVVGRRIKVNDRMTTIIGVMPPGFREPFQSEWWAPLVATGDLSNNRRSHLLRVLGRLNPDFSLDSARAELTALASGIEQDNPQIDPGLSFRAVRLQEREAAPVKAGLLGLFATVGCVLLLACANLSNLFLVRGAARTREMAIRAALGATRSRLARGLLTESLLLAFVGGIASALVAAWTLGAIRRFSPISLGGFRAASFDASVVAFVVGLTLLAGLLCGLPQALQLTRGNLQRGLREGSRSAGGRRQHRLRGLFLMTQSALALVLLVAAGLFAQSYVALLRVPLGIQPEGVLTLRMFLSREHYSEGGPQGGLYLRQILERIKSLPMIQSAGMTDALPLLGGASTDIEIAGRPVPKPGEEPEVDVRIADEDYFRTMGIRLVRGRVFTERDSFSAPRVMVINETMARTFWPNENPFGRKVTMKDWGPDLTGEVVGVVADVKLSGPGEKTRPALYWPYQQFNNPFAAIIVKAEAAPGQIIPAIKQQIWAVDREQTINSIQFMDDILSDVLAPRRFNTRLIGIFAAAALFLATLGVYAVLAQSVDERTKELGIRVALGAQPRDLLRLVLKQGMQPVLAGTLVGLGAALVVAHLISSLLFGVDARAGLTFGFVPLLLCSAALLASYFPARRAHRVDPISALREE